MSEVLDWLHQHPNAIPLTLALVAFAESLAVVGSLVPGVALIVALSVLAKHADTHLMTLLAFGWLGAVLADTLSFWLGRRYAIQVHRIVNQAGYDGWYRKAHRMAERWEWLAYPISRFMGPIRPFMPLILGALETAWPRFLLLNLLSALLWAPVYIAPGYLLGDRVDWAHLPWRWIVATLIGIGALWGCLALWRGLRPPSEATKLVTGPGDPESSPPQSPPDPAPTTADDKNPDRPALPLPPSSTT